MMRESAMSESAIRNRLAARTAVAAAVCLILVFGAGVTRAQDAPDAAGRPQATTTPAPSGMLMNFEDAPLEAVLRQISEQLGLVIIDGDRLDQRVTIQSRAPLSEQDVVEALNSLLKVHGYAAVLAGRTLRIATLDEAKRSTIPVRSGADPDEIGESDMLIRQVIPVRYGDAERLARELAGIVPSYAILGSNKASNSLIYTATEADVHHLTEIVRALDVSQSAADVVAVFQLKNADAANAATLVQNIFGPEARQQQRGADVRAFRRRFGPGQQQEEDEDAVRQQRVVAAADRQTNSVVVSAPPDIMRLIEDVLEKIDATPVRPDAVRVFKLEFAEATSTARLIEGVFNADQRTAASATTRTRQFVFPFGGRGGTDQQNAQTAEASQRVAAAADAQTNSIVVTASPTVMELIADIVEQLDTKPTAEESIFIYPLANAKAAELEGVLQEIFQVQTTAATGARTTAFAGRNGRGDARQEAAATAIADAVGDLAGKVYVVAEETTNSLLVRTAPKYFDRVREILKILDRPTRQVLIKVLIAEVTLDDSLDLGTEFSVLNIGLGSGDGQVSTDFGVVQLNGGLVARYVDADFNVTLRALQQVGKLNVLSRPYLLGSENQPARITVGEEVPYITNSRVTEAGQTVNTVDYRDIGIIMEITPYIGPDGMVILDLYQEISSRTGRTVRVSEDFDAEVYAKRSAETRVAVTNGQTVVIGGLMEDNLTETVNKVPLFGDIPLVGAAFRRTLRQKQKTELLLFLCPQTALTPAELQAVTDRARGQADLVRTVGESGAFDASLEEMCPTTQHAPCPDTQPSGEPRPAKVPRLDAPEGGMQ